MSDGKKTATILVADDDANLRGVVRAVLQRDGHRILEASCGEDALASVGAERPDLLLLDLIMPGMDGYTLLARLRDDPETQDFPVIVLSGEPGSVHADLTQQFGALRFLQKPFSLAAVREAVRQALEMRAT